MNREQAAKLAQAYQWLSEGKEVEELAMGSWRSWDGFPSNTHFRLKPEPDPLLELWVNAYEGGGLAANLSKEVAIKRATKDAMRIAVHMREVREPDIKAMVKRFLDWKVPIGDPNGRAFISLGGRATGAHLLTPEQAEQMIRHILREEK